MTTAPLPADDLGVDVVVPSPATRVVSLVPSLTEAIVSTRREALVGATDWCTHPADLDVDRVRGTKNPDRAAIAALAPDLVVANQEENRERDVERLRADGIPVWVTRIRTLDEAFASMRRLFEDALGWDAPPWLAEAERVWSAPPPADGPRVAGYQSNTPEFWKACDLIGGRSTYLLGGAFGDGKGQPVQVNAVSHGGPITRFARVNILNTGR